jgi:hypothetical protein
VDRVNNFEPMNLEELHEGDREAAIDISCALSVLMARLPAISEPMFEFLISEFSHQYGLPRNRTRYALKNLGRRLFEVNWTYEVSKQGPKLITKLTVEKETAEPE